MNKATKGKDANNIFSREFKDPFKTNPFVDPFKSTKNYKDPLRVPKESYVDPVRSKKTKPPEFRPYNSYHEYKLPDLDPLTGKPYRKGRRQAKRQEEPKKPTEPLPKSYFPSQLGSTVGSTKRMLRIQEHLNF